MRKYGKWALTLGLVAATPGLGLAAPWSRHDADKEAEKPAAKPASKNQKMADDIAVALRNARLQGYDIEIEYKDGTAILKGRVIDPKQKDKATQVVERVPGVDRVDNQLVLAPRPSPTKLLSAGVQQAGHSSGETSERVHQASHSASGPQQSQVQPVNHEQPASPNQAMAQQVADAITSANINGYDILVSFQNGTVVLGGSVETNAQRQAAERVASQVPGVTSVQNQLRTTKEPPAAPRAPMMAPGGMPVHPAAFQGAMPPGAPMPMGPGVPQMAYGHPGPGGVPAMYNLPNMPEHAWPAYAQYPNYAAVTYPSQYSASAWPYIGPFYPYPQVPLGWRDATLRWDDGYWNLQFRQRTDKWWWFLHPENW